jgi:hypothetical protein
MGPILIPMLVLQTPDHRREDGPIHIDIFEILYINTEVRR